MQRGVRQGHPISPTIFSAVLERLFRNLDWETQGITINGEHLSHLRFADDLILFLKVQELANESIKAGLTMNTSIYQTNDKL